MEPFLQKCHRYSRGQLSEAQIIGLWAEAIADDEKYKTLRMYMMLVMYYRCKIPTLRMN